MPLLDLFACVYGVVFLIGVGHRVLHLAHHRERLNFGNITVTTKAYTTLVAILLPSFRSVFSPLGLLVAIMCSGIIFLFSRQERASLSGIFDVFTRALYIFASTHFPLVCFFLISNDTRVGSMEMANQIWERRTQCRVCYDNWAGGIECQAGHFICSVCARGQLNARLESIRSEDRQLHDHRERQGRIKCVEQNCDLNYDDYALIQIMNRELYVSYRVAQDEAMDVRLQRQYEQNRHRYAQANMVIDHDRLTAEALRRDYPNARQCPRCHVGPVLHENCFNLAAHHNQQMANGARISNACSSCGYFSGDIRDWPIWNGILGGSNRR